MKRMHLCHLLRAMLRDEKWAEHRRAGTLPAAVTLEIKLPNGNLLRMECMDLTLKDDVTENFSVVLKDKFGAVTTAAQPVVVTSSDETVAVGTLSADGSTLSVATAGAGKLGTAIVTVTDAADSITAQVNVTVVAGAPASIELTDLGPAAAPAPSEAPAAETAPAETATAPQASTEAPAA